MRHSIIGFVALLAAPLFAQGQDVSASPADAVKADGAKADAPAAETPEADPFFVPAEIDDAGARELLETLQRRPAKSAAPADVQENLIKLGGVIDALLGRELSEEMKQDAALMKYQIYNVLAEQGRDGVEEERREWIEALVGSPSKDLKRIGSGIQTLQKGINLAMGEGQAAESEWSAVGDAAVSLLKARPELFEVRMSMTVANMIEQFGPEAVAGKTYMGVAAALEGTEEPELQAAAEMASGVGRRLSLMGSVMEVSGSTLDGGELSLEELRGQVVVVDFWASWCGPCVAAMSSLEELYDEHKEDGFEIVGVNLDKSREPLDQFLESRPLPWPIIQELGDGEGKESFPNATRYGVDGIPFLVVVDRNGKVIQTGFNPGELRAAVEKALKEPKPEA